MTETLTPIEILKSRQNFADYIEAHSDEIISKFLEGYPNRVLNIVIPQLTPTQDGLMDAVRELNVENAYLFWFVTNEKENLTETASKLNGMFSKNYGIFIIKAYLLNDEKIDFECLLKPEIPTKQVRKTDTPAKTLQLEYWTKYFEICDELQSEMQVNPKPQHFQYIPIGKAGVQILQTVNTQNKYVATEIMINNKKEIFEKLAEHKTEIEEELGCLEWYSQDNVKSSRIRKYLNYDITNAEETENAIRNHIKTAEEFKAVFKKYL